MVTCIFGASNRGKSTSARFIIKVLIHDSNYELVFPDKTVVEKKIKNNQDTLALFKGIEGAKGNIIAIYTGGDNNDIISCNIDSLKKEIEKITNDLASVFWIVTVKFHNDTEAAAVRKSLIKDIQGEEHVTWIEPPFVFGKGPDKKYEQCPEYELVFKAFACAVLAVYDKKYESILNNIKI